MQIIAQKIKNREYVVFKLFLMKYMTSIYECDDIKMFEIKTIHGQFESLNLPFFQCKVFLKYILPYFVLV
jgi:hypothetical protein